MNSKKKNTSKNDMEKKWEPIMNHKNVTSRYYRNSTPKLAREVATDINLTNLTLIDHDMFSSERQNKKDKKKKRS